MIKTTAQIIEEQKPLALEAGIRVQMHPYDKKSLQERIADLIVASYGKGYADGLDNGADYICAELDKLGVGRIVAEKRLEQALISKAEELLGIGRG